MDMISGPRLLNKPMRLLERILSWGAGILESLVHWLGRRRIFIWLADFLNEPLDYAALGLFLMVIYLIAGVLVPSLLQTGGIDDPAFYARFFGVNELRHFPAAFGIASFAVVLGLAVLALRYGEWLTSFFQRVSRLLYSRNIYLVLLSLFMAGIFFALRSNYLNTDGNDLTTKFQASVPTLGAHVTHDEMWELYLHSRFWLFMNQHFGWSVIFSYQVLSCAAGGVLVFAMLKFSRFLHQENALALFLLFCSGAFMQLFFGDAENYTLAMVWMVLYFFSAALYLAGKQSLLVPSALLAVAMTFHLQAGFLLPSLAYLYYRELRQKGDLNIIKGALLMAVIILLTFYFFDRHNLPIANLFQHSHAFGIFNRPGKYLPVLSISYYWQQANLALLLFPGIILLPILLIFRRIQLTPFNIFLLIASSILILYQLLWRAQLGVYNDWNLYAIVGVTLALLVWHNLVGARNLRHKPALFILLFGIFATHTMAWIISNHLIVL
jgi:hypothetical protein